MYTIRLCFSTENASINPLVRSCELLSFPTTGLPPQPPQFGEHNNAFRPSTPLPPWHAKQASLVGRLSHSLPLACRLLHLGTLALPDLSGRLSSHEQFVDVSVGNSRCLRANQPSLLLRRPSSLARVSLAHCFSCVCFSSPRQTPGAERSAKSLPGPTVRSCRADQVPKEYPSSLPEK